MARKSASFYTNTRPLAQADLRAGMSVADVAKKHKVHLITVYHWRSELASAPAPMNIEVFTGKKTTVVTINSNLSDKQTSTLRGVLDAVLS